MPVEPNRFAQRSAEAKKNQTNALRVRHYGNKGGGDKSQAAANGRMFSEWLRNFYRSNPRRLAKLAMKAIQFAEAGHARFAEMILDRLEGPVKRDESTGDTYNFNFISDAERERAKSVVDDILAMDKPITLLPQESECQTAPTSSSSEIPDSKQIPTV